MNFNKPNTNYVPNVQVPQNNSNNVNDKPKNIASIDEKITEVHANQDIITINPIEWERMKQKLLQARTINIQKEKELIEIKNKLIEKNQILINKEKEILNEKIKSNDALIDKDPREEDKDANHLSAQRIEQSNQVLENADCDDINELTTTASDVLYNIFIKISSNLPNHSSEQANSISKNSENLEEIIPNILANRFTKDSINSNDTGQSQDVPSINNPETLKNKKFTTKLYKFPIRINYSHQLSIDFEGGVKEFVKSDIFKNIVIISLLFKDSILTVDEIKFIKDHFKLQDEFLTSSLKIESQYFSSWVGSSRKKTEFLYTQIVDILFRLYICSKMGMSDVNFRSVFRLIANSPKLIPSTNPTLTIELSNFLVKENLNDIGCLIELITNEYINQNKTKNLNSRLIKKINKTPKESAEKIKKDLRNELNKPIKINKEKLKKLKNKFDLIGVNFSEFFTSFINDFNKSKKRGSFEFVYNYLKLQFFDKIAIDNKSFRNYFDSITYCSHMEIDELTHQLPTDKNLAHKRRIENDKDDENIYSKLPKISDPEEKQELEHYTIPSYCPTSNANIPDINYPEVVFIPSLKSNDDILDINYSKFVSIPISPTININNNSPSHPIEIDQGLSEHELLALIEQFKPLQPIDIKRIRKFLHLNKLQFCKYFGITSLEDYNWENENHKIQSSADKFIKLFVFFQLFCGSENNSSDEAFLKFFNSLNSNKFEQLDHLNQMPTRVNSEFEKIKYTLIDKAFFTSKDICLIKNYFHENGMNIFSDFEPELVSNWIKESQKIDLLSQTYLKLCILNTFLNDAKLFTEFFSFFQAIELLKSPFYISQDHIRKLRDFIQKKTLSLNVSDCSINDPITIDEVNTISVLNNAEDMESSCEKIDNFSMRFFRSKKLYEINGLLQNRVSGICENIFVIVKSDKKFTCTVNTIDGVEALPVSDTLSEKKREAIPRYKKIMKLFETVKNEEPLNNNESYSAFLLDVTSRNMLQQERVYIKEDGNLTITVDEIHKLVFNLKLMDYKYVNKKTDTELHFPYKQL